MSTAVQLARVVLPSSAQPAERTAVLDRELEHKLYVETVSALAGCDFDEAVVSVYSYRPEREMPRAQDSRRNLRKYLIK
jgi:hypothetical protein